MIRGAVRTIDPTSATRYSSFTIHHSPLILLVTRPVAAGHSSLNYDLRPQFTIHHLLLPVRNSARHLSLITRHCLTGGGEYGSLRGLPREHGHRLHRGCLRPGPDFP